ncbi:DUF1062 domain-containing protein [Serratia aquatilis]|uniref:DUF1062 domain-containing protein n=1 Tax=Serratia aquatilis TaxID=1737515 RepID=A0ABV6E935_9GAMM
MKVTWTVSPVGYQLIAKRCPACNVKRNFTPSGAFRINSQKKVLDVWSIYKCTFCEYTWNINLFSRLPVSKINHELYDRLIANDEVTVQYFSHDHQLLKRNGAELSGKSDFSIQERWLVNIIMSQSIRVSIQSTCSFQVSLLSTLKKQLSLSSGEIKKLIDTGDIRGVTMKELKSRKLMPAGYELLMSTESFYARRRIVLKHS